MRMDDRLQQTGADLLNSLSEDELAKALWELADEPDHQKIAHQIVGPASRRAASRGPSQLVQIIFDAKGLHPKTWRQQQRDSQVRLAAPGRPHVPGPAHPGQ